jgi:hypothetical protein
MVMNDPHSRNYIYLDGERERRQLILEIGKVRRAVLHVVENVPESGWYEPRYHGWSLAAMLGHLNLIDNVSLFFIRSALVGFRFRMSKRTVNRLNHFTIRLFQKRVVAASIKSIEHNEKVITDLILKLPMDRFSRQVFNPETQEFTTVERNLQDRFLFHWHGHLHTMREVEGIQPGQHSDTG